METVLEIGGHCIDCAAGLRAAAELLRDEAVGRWLSTRAQFWEDAALAIAERIAGGNCPRPTESVRASLYRARIKLRSAVHDRQAIIDDCLWWDSLTRAHCTKALKKGQNPAVAALLAEISSGSSARAVFDSIHDQPNLPAQSGSAQQARSFKVWAFACRGSHPIAYPQSPKLENEQGSARPIQFRDFPGACAAG